MVTQFSSSSPAHEPTRFARVIVSMALAPTQLTMFSGSEEEQGASQFFRSRALGVVEPLLAQARKLLSERLAALAGVDIRDRIEGDIWVVQITATSDSEFEPAAVQQISEAGAAMAGRLAGAMVAIASPLPFTRSAENRGDSLYDEVAQVKKRGVPSDFSYALQVGYIARAEGLKFTEVERRAKSPWLEDLDPATPWLEVIIRSSRGGTQLAVVTLDGKPAFQVDVDEKDNSESNLAAKAHALCGGSTCWVQVRRCTEICKEAPEILRQVHHLIDVEVRDALQLKHLQSLHTATARLIERAKEFERADSQRAKKKRPPDASET